MLGIDGDDFRAVCLRFRHDESARADERFLIGKTDSFLFVNCRHGGTKPYHAHDSRDDRIRGVDFRGGNQSLHAGEDLTFRVAQTGFQLFGGGFIIDRHDFGTEFPCLLFQKVDASVRRYRGNAIAELFDYVKALRTDGAGGAEYTDTTHKKRLHIRQQTFRSADERFE